jgi:hypothetical protein
VGAPYCTAHKILKGLLDAYLATDDARALDLASGMCDWMYSRLSRLPDSTLQRMWGIFSSGEFGGIVETIVDLYSITGKADHLALPKLFDLDKLIDACAANTDTLDGLAQAGPHAVLPRPGAQVHGWSTTSGPCTTRSSAPSRTRRTRRSRPTRRTDGTTLLDEIWAGAPFSNKSALVTDRRWSPRRRTRHTRPDGGRIRLRTHHRTRLDPRRGALGHASAPGRRTP